ncbi:hypothetical protein AC578_2884 [Pseudocercospora eumusae]|uniref:Serine aminopeptidase S33 domain-containing protein n=1 Tax=Pseudocercospora eumusae TaxID=321146 RepID=A0A139GY99_9PEZI|nr:hypothetical protein AC578_2884 [Pseudocercospora eumusae]
MPRCNACLANRVGNLGPRFFPWLLVCAKPYSSPFAAPHLSRLLCRNSRCHSLRAMSSYSGPAGHTTHFNIQKHKLPASHIREYPRATTDDQEEVLHLAIKHYTPISPAGSEKNGVTIIGGHANGFPKELYEPLWDDLYERLQKQGVHINSIWIADVSHQGDSGVLNEDILGNDPSWFDHPRDLFLMINHFREHMKRPIIGIGHSMGGNNLVNLALMHPRLFTTLILIDPVIQRYPSVGGNFGPARASTVRRDRWPSRQEAETKAKKSKVFQTWDPRVLQKWMEYGFRELPTPLYPTMQKISNPVPPISADPTTSSIPPDPTTEKELTLKTTKFQEVFTFLRPNFPTQEFPDPENSPNPQTHPDVPAWTSPKSPFYRPEPLVTFTRLPNLRPSVLYIFGELSDLSAPLLRADRLAQTGIGWGGSGGVGKDRVKEHVFEGVGHLIPMEVVGETADVSAGWVGEEIRRWKRTEEEFRREWERVPKGEKAVFSEEFKRQMLGDWVVIKKKEEEGGEGKSKL